MKNVFCDFCGSAYPETESNCPICGTSREFSMDGDFLASELFDENGEYQDSLTSSKKTKEIFDYDEVNPEPDMEPEELDYDEEYESRKGGSNAVLVVILLILIVLLLATAGFLYLRFFLPNMQSDPAETVPVVTTEATVPTEVETEPVVQDGIPCTDIVMEGGKIELGKDGKWLLNVKVYPSDTTDALVYSSADESVATVSTSGTVTAVGEGETTITIACGEKQIKCSVLVDYALVAEEAQEGTLPTLEVEAEETTGETEAEEIPQETTEEVKPEETEASAQTLKLKKSDITIFSNHTSVRLELEGDINPEDVKWFTIDSTVAICHNGVITSTGSGITRIIGEYKGQQVECLVRCNF